jgi:chromosome segregation ATPase
MTILLTREQAEAAASSAASERDTIQANLLELDGSFGKRLLAGATLTGPSRDAWDQASASLVNLWDTFTAYSAVIDRAAQIVAAPGRIPVQRLEEAAALLTGPSVRLARAVVPLGQRELTSGGETSITLQATVREMRSAFSQVATVLTAAETVWNEISDGIRQVTTEVETAKQQLAGLGDDELAGAVAQVETDLTELRDLLNSDPLSLWSGNRADRSRLDRLSQEASAVTAQVARLARVRDDADQQLADVTTAVAAAQQAHSDATKAREHAASRIILVADYKLLPDVSVLTRRVEGLRALRASGRWTRLAAELDQVSEQAAAVRKQCGDAEHAAVGLVGRRDELRGLLDAYRAKAGGTGGAENAELDQRFTEARDLLWTAPCDLAAASAAVRTYQQAVLHLRRSGERS